MTREEMIFEMAKAIAPVIAQQGINTQLELIRSGRNPEDCTIGGRCIPNSYGESLKVWATAFVDELNITEEQL